VSEIEYGVSDVRDKRAFSISVETLLFGAIALNLLVLMCVAVLLGTWLIIVWNYDWYDQLGPISSLAKTLGTLPFDFVWFVYDIFCILILTEIVRFCIWGAKGFLEYRPVPVIAVTIFFIFYGMATSISGMMDGYVALCTVGLTAGVVIITRRQQIYALMLKYIAR
jgi:hypothetical protein